MKSFLTANTFIICLFILVGCSGEFVYRKDIEQLSKPGALDLSLTGFYSHYQYKLLDKYRISHQWLRESACDYRTIEAKKYDGADRFFIVRDIYEEGGSTWQRFDVKTGNFNFDSFVRPQYTVKTQNGLKVEKGHNVLCLETWWTTSHSVALFLHKQSLDEMKADFTKRYPEGVWTTKTVNDLTWYVQETPQAKFRSRPLNGVGGPFQTWVLPLADTGYVMAIELGASKESLQYPEAQARMVVMLKHLIESVSIEPIQTADADLKQVASSK